MAVRFHPLPIEVFPKAAGPAIKRLNLELRDLFGLEGTLKDPRQTRRSDLTVARRESAQVDISRITPSISASIAGVSTVIGAPNLTFGTANAVGTTRTVLSVNSTIKAFDTTVPIGIALDGAGSVGSNALLSRNDHAHGLTASSPSGGFSTSASEGTAASVLRSDAVFEHPTTLQSPTTSATFAFTDDGTDCFLINDLGDLTINPKSGQELKLATGATDVIGIGALTNSKYKVYSYFYSTAGTASALRFLFVSQGNLVTQYGVSGIVQTGTAATQGTGTNIGGEFQVIARGNKAISKLEAVRADLQWGSGSGGSSDVSDGYGVRVVTATRTGSGIFTRLYGIKTEAQPDFVTTPLGANFGDPVEITAQAASGSRVAATVLKLTQSNTGATTGAHINFSDKAGDDGSAVEGDYWRTGDDMKFEDSGATRVTCWLDATQTLAAKTLTTPTIADMTNAVHGHTDAEGGGVVSHVVVGNSGVNSHAIIDTHLGALYKDITIEGLTPSENIPCFKTPIAITGTTVSVVLRGTGVSHGCNLALFHSTNRSSGGAGNSLTVGETYYSITAGSDATLSDATIPAMSYIYLMTPPSGISGVNYDVAVHFDYTEDA